MLLVLFLILSFLIVIRVSVSDPTGQCVSVTNRFDDAINAQQNETIDVHNEPIGTVGLLNLNEEILRSDPLINQQLLLNIGVQVAIKKSLERGGVQVPNG